MDRICTSDNRNLYIRLRVRPRFHGIPIMAFMTVKDVEARVERIASLSHDPEAAHIAEDQLYRDVLKSIAEGICNDPAGCARAALKTGDLGFPRWVS